MCYQLFVVAECPPLILNIWLTILQFLAAFEGGHADRGPSGMSRQFGARLDSRPLEVT
jgi:hypothetical protein